MNIDFYKYGYLDGLPAVYAEIYMDEIPTGGLPANTDNMSPLKSGCAWMTGSRIFIVGTGELYMYKSSTAEWVKQ